MDITKAKRLIELRKPDSNQKILLTLWEGGQVSSCVENQQKTYCETCQGDDRLCQDYVEHLKGKGYQATEVELGELALEESLPRFLEEREVTVKPEVAAGVELKAVVKEEETQPEATTATEPEAITEGEEK